MSVSEDFGAAVVADAGDPVTIAPKSSGLLKPFGVGLRGDVFDYALQLVGEADTVVATSDIAYRRHDRASRSSVRFMPRGCVDRFRRRRSIGLALLGPSSAMTATRAAELGLVDEIVDVDALEAALVRRLLRFSGG